MQTLAARRYGIARSIAGTPHLSPRRVRIASSRMLVGMYLRMKLRRWMLTTQMIRSMTTVLSWFGNVEPWRTALGPSCHRAGDGEH
ncbi:hypothetical protein DC31_11280 [Microbacterium sp. CH12i]|nr:hypothetical protein DC31_11280 [Microbacterium sp. CH12i]